jgi:omega-6 fatty acid desaturase (delta-12 desaturase)
MKFVNEQRLRSWGLVVSTLSMLVAAFTATWFIEPWWARITCGILAALLTTRLFVIYHDYMHGAILGGSAIARVLMYVFGILVLAPPSIWNESHEHHHKTNSRFSKFVVGSFPTVSTVLFTEMTRSQRLWYLILRHPLVVLFAYLPVFLISFCFWPFFENPKKYWDCGVAGFTHIIIATLIVMFNGWTDLLYVVIIPSTFAFGLGAYIFYAQHNFRTVKLYQDNQWDYLEAALQSSSFIRMSRVMHWFTANVGYHHVHHVNSRIPFYRLPEAMKAIPSLHHPNETSLNPIEIWHCLQLKLWDDRQGKLITLKDYHDRHKSP